MGEPSSDRVQVRCTEPQDFAQIGSLCRQVYPNEAPWTPAQLASHRRVFPEGQFVAIDREADRVVGMSASLIVRWDHYDMLDSWEDFTADGMFTNHDPIRGHTLYGAEVIVDPTLQGHGMGGSPSGRPRRLFKRSGWLGFAGGAGMRATHHTGNGLSPPDAVTKVVTGGSA